ncbi:kinase-like domain-containing protein [Trichoderma sp. SZMC 28014]
MPDEVVSEAQSTPSKDAVTFAIFSAANTAAVHLLESVRSETSSPTLFRDGLTIGYELSSQSSGKCEEDIWRIGAGPTTAMIEKNLDHLKPYIQLCPPGDSIGTTIARKFIKDIHASIYVHPKSGVLVLKTKCSLRKVIYEQGDMDQKDLVLSLPDRQSCVLRRSQNFLNFGDYRFALESVIQARDENKIKAQPSGYRGLRLSPTLGPSLTAYSTTTWNIWLHNRIPDTSVFSGVNIYTGEPVALKHMPNKLASTPYTRNRLQIGLQYGESLDKGVLGILDVWCEHNISPPCSADSRQNMDDDICKRTIYSMPLATNNFCDMPWAEIEYENCLAFFYQTLVGLAELHRQNIVHGHLVPESLLIFTEPESMAESKSPTQRAVISINMRKRKKKPEASVCIAPEIWESQIEQNEKLDETKIDIWGLAASWLYAFMLPPKELKITKQTDGELRQSLDDHLKQGNIKEPLAKLLHRMLSSEPQDRPSSADALADEVWRPIKDQQQKEEDCRKRKRADMMKSEDKRVRVLSPDLDE